MFKSFIKLLVIFGLFFSVSASNYSVIHASGLGKLARLLSATKDLESSLKQLNLASLRYPDTNNFYFWLAQHKKYLLSVHNFEAACLAASRDKFLDEKLKVTSDFISSSNIRETDIKQLILNYRGVEGPEYECMYEVLNTLHSVEVEFSKVYKPYSDPE